STNRVAVSLPASKAFTHALKLPKMKLKDIEEAVLTEAEQYIPANPEELYIDYTTLNEDADNIEVLIVAFPRSIVDSYLILTRMLGLEAVLMDTTIGASARLFGLDKRSEAPAVLIDFGANSTDITIYNHGLVVTGTVPYGGDDITKTISSTLKISNQEALTMKSNLGLTVSDVQKQVTDSISPTLELIMKEIKRTIRYYEQRYPDQPALKQVIIMGGGANMPGLADFLTSSLRLAVRTIALENHIDFDHLHPFYKADRMSYVTASGLALTKPEEVLA
ncbi:MAG TPA: pilus assembly protein PilM, partial [Candidatus Saccharimonadales bacterium]